MNTKTAFALLASLACAGAASAQLSVPWYTIDCGGGTSTGGTFSLSGTIGQPDAGAMSGGTFQLNGGYWVGGGTPTGCDSIDFNGDGLFPDTDDISHFILVFGGAPCPTGTCADIDFNNDGLFPDTDDIVALIRVFSGGPCVE
ncbi:MAG TPA: hypothetical protein VHN77_05760 [Phycisphaerales bacterium]|nr:hypothetical protein [Phycisphaerales bacterium]